MFTWQSTAEHGPLVSIQREGVESTLFVPENFVELGKELGSFAPQIGGTLSVAEMLVNLGGSTPRVIDVALQLAYGLGSFDERAIRIDQRLAGILPIARCEGPTLTSSGMIRLCAWITRHIQNVR